MPSTTPCVPCCTTPQTVNIPGTEGSAGVNAYTTTTADFVVPAVNNSVNVLVENNSWVVVGQAVVVAVVDSDHAATFQVTAKAGSTGLTLEYLSYVNNDQAGGTVVSGSLLSPGGFQASIDNPLAVANGGTGGTTVYNALSALGVVIAPRTAFGAGTAYSLTTTPALLNLGTTTPSISVGALGRFLIFARARLDLNAATFPAVRTATLKLRRTNNTAGDLSNSSVGFKIPINAGTLSHTVCHLSWFTLYDAVADDDIIQAWGSVDTLPTAGTLDCAEATLIAIRLYPAP